jgi:hypothetical protein
MQLTILSNYLSKILGVAKPPKSFRLAGNRTLKALLLLVACLSCFSLQAQDIGLQWAKGIIESAAGQQARVYGVDTDASGNVYITGDFTGTVDLNPGTGTVNVASAGGWDSFVVKLDRYGNYIWGKRFGSTSTDTGHGIFVDPAGNVFTTGYITGTVDMNPGGAVNNLVTNSGSSDGYLLKLDTNGNYVWAQRMGGPGPEYSFNVKTDLSGNVFVTGFITPGGPATFGGFSITTAGGNDAFVAKLNAAGAYQWCDVWEVPVTRWPGDLTSIQPGTFIFRAHRTEQPRVWRLWESADM